MDFPADETERRLETFVNWGRYTELLAYDNTSDVFYPEPAGAAPSLTGNSGKARTATQTGALGSDGALHVGNDGGMVAVCEGITG